MRTRFFIFAAWMILCGASQSFAAEGPIVNIPTLERYTGRLYEFGTQRKKLFFKVENALETLPDGHQRIRTTFTNADGTTNLIEDAILAQGKLLKYSIHRVQENEYSEASLEGSGAQTQVKFLHRKGDRVRTDDELATNSFVLNPTFGPYLHSQWDRLLQGETVNVRYGATEMRETIGFNLSKEDAPPFSSRVGTETLVVKMKPSSIFIAAVVPAMYFTFEKSGARRLLEFQGQALPRLAVDGKFKDVKVEAVYEAAPVPSPVASHALTP